MPGYIDNENHFHVDGFSILRTDVEGADFAEERPGAMVAQQV